MEERKMILSMLNEGKITSEEAIRLLEAIGQDNVVEEKKQNQSEPTTSITKSDNMDQYYKKESDKTKEKYKEPSLTERISQLVDRVAQKVKDVDLDFNFGSYVEVKHIFQDQDLDFTSLNIHVPNGKVSLQPWEESGVRVECHALVYKVETNEEAKERFINAVLMETKENGFYFKVNDKQVKTDVIFYIPRKQYAAAMLQLGNGAIDIKDFTIDILKGTTANGAVTLNNLSGESIDIETKNGAIKLLGGTWNKGELETWNGAITVDGAVNDLEAETLNGSVTYQMATPVKGNADLKTVTGKINMKLPSELEVNGQLKTFAGGLHCNLDNQETLEERKDYATKYLRFNANKGAVLAYNVIAETKTGSIYIEKSN